MTSHLYGGYGRLRNPFLRQPWAAQAQCVGMDPEAFFPDPGELAPRVRLVCRGCPVRIECREWAIENGEAGIWGATTENDRANERRRRRAS
jgi:WhiB family redox-sensing transcriptional regulator